MLHAVNPLQVFDRPATLKILNLSKDTLDRLEARGEGPPKNFSGAHAAASLSLALAYARSRRPPRIGPPRGRLSVRETGGLGHVCPQICALHASWRRPGSFREASGLSGPLAACSPPMFVR